MSLRTLLITAAFIPLVLAPSLAAQRAVGSLDGTIRERVGTRSVRAAVVSVVDFDSESSHTITSHPDAQGRFRFDSLPAGRYLIQVAVPTLDSLEISLPAERVEIQGTSSVIGDVHTKTIVVLEGGKLNGSVIMTEQGPAANGEGRA